MIIISHNNGTFLPAEESQQLSCSMSRLNESCVETYYMHIYHVASLSLLLSRVCSSFSLSLRLVLYLVYYVLYDSR
jgi:hypothetical protein